MMRRLMTLAAVTLALAGCASQTPKTAAPAPAAPAPTPAMPPSSSATRPAPSVPPVAPQMSRDACGADEAQTLVGRPRSEIPIPMHPALQRVACTTCPVTMDFNPRRLNFFYEASSGIIKEVKCG